MSTSQKILICGFPHCGTTILRTIIGHIEDVKEIITETPYINETSNKKFILCKFPFTHDEFFGEDYKDYIKIILKKIYILLNTKIYLRIIMKNLKKY